MPLVTRDYWIADGEERWSPRFAERLAALNAIVVASGAPLEGNLCYLNRDRHFATRGGPDPRRAHKRRNMARAAAGRSVLFEIGINAGHSALIALSAEPALRYVGVDLGLHPYVAPAIALLKEAFPGRVEAYLGDSSAVVPRLAQDGGLPPVDLLHVDGGHSAETCRSDLANVLSLPHAGTQFLLLDDVNLPRIRAIYDEAAAAGWFRTDDRAGTWEGADNLLAEVLPAAPRTRLHRLPEPPIAAA